MLHSGGYTNYESTEANEVTDDALRRKQRRKQQKEQELDDWGIPKVVRLQRQAERRGGAGQSSERPRSRTLAYVDKDKFDEKLEGVRRYEGEGGG